MNVALKATVQTRKGREGRKQVQRGREEKTSAKKHTSCTVFLGSFYEFIIFYCAAASSNPVSDQHTYKRLESELTQHFALQICTLTLNDVFLGCMQPGTVGVGTSHPIRHPGKEFGKRRTRGSNKLELRRVSSSPFALQKKARRLLFSVLLLTCRVLAPCNYVVNAFYLCAAEALEPYRHLE